MSTTIRARGREILRSELADAAAQFCAERGFDAVTVDDIAQAIGVSRATFFRYFPTKEDAIVAALRLGRGSLAEELSAAHPEPGRAVMQAMRDALAPTVRAVRAHPRELRARVRMIGASPALRARLASERFEQRTALEQVLARLVIDPVAAHAAAHGAMAAVDLAWKLWDADTDADFGDTLDTAFRLMLSLDDMTFDSRD